MDFHLKKNFTYISKNIYKINSTSKLNLYKIIITKLC